MSEKHYLLQSRKASIIVDVVDDIQNWTSGASRTIDLDGCIECDLLWFDKDKKEEVLSRDGTIIPKGATNDSASQSGFKIH